MKTKLVYVITSSLNDTYIEQAMVSIYSARYWMPEAWIVALTDNTTYSYIHSSDSHRQDILDYISEEKVIPFDNQVSMLYRSRWIKTNIRNLIDGDFLFIDCDTVIRKPLSEIDDWRIEIGAVPESNLPVKCFCSSLFNHNNNFTLKLGVNLTNEEYYFCSGVMFVRDTENTKSLYKMWHSYWKQSCEIGICADQPSLCKSNIELGRIIQVIPNAYDYIAYTCNNSIDKASIVHISSYRCASYLFSNNVLRFIRDKGIHNQWLIESIIKPECTFLPFDYMVLHSSFYSRIKWVKNISYYWKGYGTIVDNNYKAFICNSKLRKVIVVLFQYNLFFIGASLWMMWKRYKVITKKDRVTNNICSIEVDKIKSDGINES